MNTPAGISYGVNMLALAALVVLAQSPECITVSGKKVCGYDCKGEGTSAACATTPAGVCSKGPGGKVLCFDPPTWLTRVGSIPKPACEWRGAAGACGYDCKAQGNAIACAQTPRGACEARYDRVVCADPPPEVYGVHGMDAPKVECTSRDNMIACGYGCVSAGSSALACAKTPFGACAERNAQVVCFDPEPLLVCASGTSTPKPACLYGAGQLKCGYNCVETSAGVGCSKTPEGKCDSGGPGAPVCFDPPVRGGAEKCLSVLGVK